MTKYRYEKISPESIETRRKTTDQLDFINEAGAEGGRLVCFDALGFAFIEYVEEEAQPAVTTAPAQTARQRRARVPGT